MVVFRDLKGILKAAVQWENKLTDYYSAAEDAVKDKECFCIVDILKRHHANNLRIVRDIRVEDYGRDEWIQSTPDCNVNFLLPIEEINEESTFEEIMGHVLEFEKKMKGFYASVSGKIITREEKELFDSLVQFKEGQILEIKRFLEVS